MPSRSVCSRLTILLLYSRRKILYLSPSRSHSKTRIIPLRFIADGCQAGSALKPMETWSPTLKLLDRLLYFVVSVCIRPLIAEARQGVCCSSGVQSAKRRWSNPSATFLLLWSKESCFQCFLSLSNNSAFDNTSDIIPSNMGH